jgi:hypothetical protein
VRTTTRPGPPAGTLLAIALGASFLGACGAVPLPSPTGGNAAPSVTDGSSASIEPAATAVPTPGRELYGFLPYWEMDATIADHLATTPLTTLALFSVTDTAKGALNTKQTGYKRITGDLGARIIHEAHGRGVRVDLVFTSFGSARNDAFFADETRQDATIAALVALVGDLGLDGICVDVEGLDPMSLVEYGSFTRRLHDALIAADPGDRVTAATSGSALGASMAATAVAAGAERVFLMGYDYRVADSSPGATSPLHKRDGDRDLGWSVELYAAAGVPAEQTLLGLPLYGMTWPVAGPVVGAPQTGRGEAWIPRRHLDLLTDPSIVPLRDAQEMVEVYLFGSDGSIGPPSPSATGLPASPPPGPAATSGSSPPRPSATSGGSPPRPSPTPLDVAWTAVYVDSPATLASKMGLANANGFAGVGFWAIGYERGLPGYTALMERFVSGQPLQ